MMVQSAPEGEPHFVSTMREHLDFCGRLALAYGNNQFEALKPYDEVLYVVENHDRGWDEYDIKPGLDPTTHLPFLMSQTPAPDAVKTNRGSPDFNESHHPYCGLLSSMHTWGLYNKRYGFTQFVVRTRRQISVPVQTANRPLIDAMLVGELERQTRLKEKLAANPATRDWLADEHLFQNYKQLTFFDTLALYFHLNHACDRGEEVYIHVPMSAEADTNVTMKKLGDQVYSLDPFPFRDTVKVACSGRYVRPFPADFQADMLGAALRAMPSDQQAVELVPA